jgi:hypothetical protein
MLFKQITTLLLTCLLLANNAVVLRAETPDEWVKLGRRVHGDFGSYIAVGIRIGLDAVKRLQAQPRDLKVTYQEGQNSPCPCVVDGMAIAFFYSQKVVSLNARFISACLHKMKILAQPFPTVDPPPIPLLCCAFLLDLGCRQA